MRLDHLLSMENKVSQKLACIQGQIEFRDLSLFNFEDKALRGFQPEDMGV